MAKEIWDPSVDGRDCVSGRAHGYRVAYGLFERVIQRLFAGLMLEARCVSVGSWSKVGTSALSRRGFARAIDQQFIKTKGQSPPY